MNTGDKLIREKFHGYFTRRWLLHVCVISSGVLFTIQSFWNQNSVSANLILLPMEDKILFKGRYQHSYWNIEFVKIYLEFLSKHRFYNFEI
jgi:hypothetical protein